MKFWGGMFMKFSNQASALLEPLLTALPNSLQCVRVGPLAPTATYSSRDFAITNIIAAFVTFAPIWFFFKSTSTMRALKRD